MAEELAKSVSARGFEAAAAEAGAVREAVGPDIQLEQAVRKSKEVHVGEITVASVGVVPCARRHACCS